MKQRSAAEDEIVAQRRWWAVWRWKLHWQILLGLAAGTGLGLLSGRWAVGSALAAMDGQASAATAAEARRLLMARWDFSLYQLGGDLFLNGLKLIVVPLVMSSLITAVAGIGNRHGFARLGLKTLTYYLVTSLLAILVGLTLMNAVRPGATTSGQPVLSVEGGARFARETADLVSKTAGKDAGDFLETIRQMVPANLVAAAAEGQLLGLIVVSMLIGFFMTRLAARHLAVLRDFWEAVYEVTLMITDLVLRFAPLGVAALLARTLSENYAAMSLDDRLHEFVRVIGLFFVTVLAGLTIHMLVVLPLFLVLAGRVNPARHYRAMMPALLTAFSTASSSATLPVTMECVEKRAGVSNHTASFVLPLGATVNMDGTALYECAAAMFVAQLYGIELTVAQQFFVVTAALLTSVGVAGVPAASLVAIVIILKGVGVPLEGLALVLMVDRPLDMARTAVNIFSDTCGAVIIARSEGEEGVLTGAGA